MSIRNRCVFTFYAVAVLTCVVLAAAPAHARSLFSQYNAMGQAYEVYWVSTNQHVNQFRYDGTWHTADVTALAGGELAEPGSAISGTSFNSIARTSEVYFTTPNHHVGLLWYNGTWHYGDLTTATGAPAAAVGTRLASANPGSSSQSAQVFWISSTQHLCKFYYDGAWHWTDVTATARAPIAASGTGLSVNSAVVNLPAEAYYVASNGHVFSVSQDSTWHVTDLTSTVGAVVASAGTDLTSHINSVASTMEVYFVSSDHKVRQFWRSITPSGPTGAWSGGATLNSVAGGPDAVITGGLGSQYVPGAGTFEVYYVTPDQKIGQYWYNGAWHAGDFTAATAPPAAAVATAVSSQYNGIAGTSEIYYVGGDNHVYLLWYNGTWHVGDLSKATGAPNANP